MIIHSARRVVFVRLISLLVRFADGNDHDNRPQLEREPTQLSDEFAQHLHASSDSHPVPQDDDMNDSDLDKAATRIQASYRGYKTRKELGSGTGGSFAEHEQNQPSSDSSPTHDEHARNKNSKSSIPYACAAILSM